MRTLDTSIEFALGLISSFDLRVVSPTCKGHVLQPITIDRRDRLAPSRMTQEPVRMTAEG